MSQTGQAGKDIPTKTYSCNYIGGSTKYGLMYPRDALLSYLLFINKIDFAPLKKELFILS